MLSNKASERINCASSASGLELKEYVVGKVNEIIIKFNSRMRYDFFMFQYVSNRA